MKTRRRVLFLTLAIELVAASFVLTSVDAGTYGFMKRQLGLSRPVKSAPIYDGPGIGEKAPEFRLEERKGGRTVSLSELRGKPLVLLFGSYTCLFFQQAVGEIGKLRHEFGDRARVVVIYTQESHGVDQIVPSKSNLKQVKFSCTLEDRRKMAELTAVENKLTLPVLLDSMDDRTAKAYAAPSARLYVLDADGRVAYKGPHPFVHVDNALPVLKRLLSTASASPS